MADKPRKKRTEIDPVFKEVLTKRLGMYQADLQTEVEVSRLPRTIDALFTVEDDKERQRICRETPFYYLTQTNQIEFKGIRDRLTTKEYHKIKGRTHFLLSERDIAPLDMTVAIISAGKPNTILKYAETLKRPFVPISGKDGYYKQDGIPPVYLLVANELPIAPINYPLLVFASSEKKFRDYLAQAIAERETAYLRYAYEVRPQITREVLTMSGLSSTLTREDLEFMAEDIGPELVPFLKPEDLLKGMDPEKRLNLISLLNLEDRLAGISMEEFLRRIGLEKLLHEISPESRQMLLELLIKMQSSSATDQEDDNGGSISQ